MGFRPIGCHPAVVVYDAPDPPVPERSARNCPDEYALGADLGEVSPGYHLIADGFCLHRGYLTLFYSSTGGLSGRWEPSELSLNAWYDADVSPASGNYHGSIGLSEDGDRIEGHVEYDAPPTAATVAWFDFFPVDFDIDMHIDKHWVPDSDYLSNRLSRLTIDLASRTASFELFK
jgi:hypothetical protein